MMFSYLWKSIRQTLKIYGVFVFDIRVFLYNEACKRVKIWVKLDILPMVLYNDTTKNGLSSKKRLYFKPDMFDIFLHLTSWLIYF
jgi:hypothetical protein